MGVFLDGQWFLDLDGANSQRFSLQLPLRDNDVVADRKPFVSPWSTSPIAVRGRV